MMILNWKKTLGLHGLYKSISPLYGLIVCIRFSCYDDFYPPPVGEGGFQSRQDSVCCDLSLCDLYFDSWALPHRRQTGICSGMHARGSHYLSLLSYGVLHGKKINRSRVEIAD